MPPALIVLFYLISISPTARDAAICGFVFGMTFFGCGLWWIFLALSGYIGLPIVAAAAIMLLFCAALSSYPAAAAWVGAKIGGIGGTIALAGAWSIAEWLRGQLFSGFPWLAIGYSQPPQSPLYGWLPLLGIGGLNLMLALAATLIIVFFRLSKRQKIAAGATLATIIGGGMLRPEWTTAVDKITVSLLQGNVKQRLKWQDGAVEKALRDYLSMTRESPGRWVILPETALPMRLTDLPGDYLGALRQSATARDGAIIAGMFVEERGELVEERGKLYNAAVAIGDFPVADYRKQHLTPYGEYLPFAAILRPLLLAADIPYNDLAAADGARALNLPGGRAAVSICYEDIFADEWRAQLPAAQVLINITNDGWFDNSAMLRQHLRMSQVRAAEFGRDLARATNTGMTALVNSRGLVQAELTAGVQGVLSGEMILRDGATPFVRFGELPMLILSALLIVGGWLWRRTIGRI